MIILKTSIGFIWSLCMVQRYTSYGFVVAYIFFLWCSCFYFIFRCVSIRCFPFYYVYLERNIVEQEEKCTTFKCNVVEYAFIAYSVPGVWASKLPSTAHWTERQQRKRSDRIERNWHREWKRHIWCLMCGYWMDEVLWYFSLVLIVCIFTASLSVCAFSCCFFFSVFLFWFLFFHVKFQFFFPSSLYLYRIYSMYFFFSLCVCLVISDLPYKNIRRIIYYMCRF